jgi:hypothetical protein
MLKMGATGINQPTKEDEMGRACSTYGEVKEEEECI